MASALRHGEILSDTASDAVESPSAGAAPSIRLPKLLLHCCCAPCSSYALECLSPDYSITALFYNPNIKPAEEYDKRAGEMGKLLSSACYPNGVDLLVVDHGGSAFDALAGPFMDEPEGGRRCRMCFELRLGEAARLARDGGCDFFATTLPVSPHKDAAVINDVGGKIALEYGIGYLPADFKKRGGYARSVELSKLYGLYRQGYCGCRPR